jgi:hypothetical protein
MINPNWWQITYRSCVYYKSQKDYIEDFEFNFDETTFLIAALSEIRD